jgi:hypothetical protein
MQFMKKNFILFVLVLGILFVGFIQLNSNPTGAPAGYTDSPADGQTCGTSGCHNATAAIATNVLTTNIPTAGYTPGQNYTITVTITGTTARKGFEVTVQNSSGILQGVLASGSGSKIIGTKYVTHTTYKSTATSSWSFNWIAPVKGTGNITIYGAFVNGKPNVSKQFLLINEIDTALIRPSVSSTNVVELNSTAASIDATINPNGKTYNASFQYKDSLSSIWNTVAAIPGSVSGNTPTSIFYTVTGLTSNATYFYRACAWNTVDTTWGATRSFKISSGTNVVENIKPTINSIFPNPSKDFIQLDFTNHQNSEVKINICLI